MNKFQYLLICLSEECAEVQKAISKALRFGLNDFKPGVYINNSDNLKDEVVDIYAIIELLEEKHGFKIIPYRKQIESKKKKVKKYMEYSKKIGILKENQ